MSHCHEHMLTHIAMLHTENTAMTEIVVCMNVIFNNAELVALVAEQDTISLCLMSVQATHNALVSAVHSF